MYYLCSENKGADQLRSYCEAVSPMQIVGFPMQFILVQIRIIKSEISWKLIYKEREKQHDVSGNVYAFLLTTHIQSEDIPQNCGIYGK